MTAVQTTTDQYLMSEAEAVEKGEGTCSTCTWWKPPNTKDRRSTPTKGRCGLRFPPAFTMQNRHNETGATESCSFHQPAKGP